MLSNWTCLSCEITFAVDWALAIKNQLPIPAWTHSLPQIVHVIHSKCYVFSCSHLLVDFIELSFAFQQSDIFSPQDVVMIESQQKAIVTFGSKAHAVQFAKQWNRYSSLFPLLDRFGLSVKHLLLACPITTELF